MNGNSTDEWRLVWFQHFHKAAGTTIVELAKLNGLRLYPKHTNGSPLDNKGNVIPLWKYSNKELRLWFGECMSKDIGFIATEWGCPDIVNLMQFQCCTTMSVFRDPLSRFISNFNYDRAYAFTSAKTLVEYLDSVSYASNNYYTRMLLGIKKSSQAVNDDQFEFALTALKAFDILIIQELPESFSFLVHELSWSNVKKYHVNKLFWTSLRHRLKLLTSGKFRAAYDSLTAKQVSPSQELTDWFSEFNAMDLKLYEEATKIVQERLLRLESRQI